VTATDSLFSPADALGADWRDEVRELAASAMP